MITRARDLGTAIANAAQSNQGIDYQTAATVYLNREPGNIYWREYVDFIRRLEVAQYKVAALGDDGDHGFTPVVLEITGEALGLTPRDSRPRVKKLHGSLTRFMAGAIPDRFGSRGWRRAVRMATRFRRWLLADVADAIAEAKKSSDR